MALNASLGAGASSTCLLLLLLRHLLRLLGHLLRLLSGLECEHGCQ
jgi:hypothetical protein